MIKIKNINKRFEKLHVLKDINISFEAGNIIALIGPNACGKTTLIKTILGMVIPDSGTIEVMDKSIQNQWLYRDQIGYMPQIGKYPDNMTVGQIIEMVEDIRTKDDKNLDKELYESFKIYDILNKRMNTLSGGTRQKISAYLAFLFNPKILILDEPTAGLDPISSLILREKILKEKENGKLILITSHILSELDDMIDRIAYMEDGKMIFDKTIEEVKSETSETKLWNAIAHIMNQNNN
ncbi:MAG: ABC transporter ATP-binding protein [Chitinophagales bacterium]|nr:ABC transporter ATP-binding protein [Chitinophagales bacterium]